MKGYFVTGIGTEVGKTVASAILTEALEADYWKPVQAGDLNNSDTRKVKAWISNDKSQIHDEGYRLTHPMSPHAAAELDGVRIELDGLLRPETSNSLIVEGAGGLMVPLNDRDLIIDLIKALNFEVILVSRHYLGSINHTLLSVKALKQEGIPIKGIIFNGTEHPTTEKVILAQTGLKMLGRIKEHSTITQEVVLQYKSEFSAI